MKTFILFIYGGFDDYEDIIFFCTEILSDTPAVKSLKYVIESSQNIIIIFDSELDNKELSHEIHNLLVNDMVKFYFMFEKNTLIDAHLPENVKNFIFNPPIGPSEIKINYVKNSYEQLDLDEVLDKIENMGMDSLTEKEKKFLDNFDN